MGPQHSSPVRLLAQTQPLYKVSLAWVVCTFETTFKNWYISHKNPDSLLLLKNDHWAIPALQWQHYLGHKASLVTEVLPGLFSPKCPACRLGVGFPCLWIIPCKCHKAAVTKTQAKHRDMKNRDAGTHPEEGLPGRSLALLGTEVGDKMPREWLIGGMGVKKILQRKQLEAKVWHHGVERNLFWGAIDGWFLGLESGLKIFPVACRTIWWPPEGAPAQHSLGWLLPPATSLTPMEPRAYPAY